MSAMPQSALTNASPRRTLRERMRRSAPAYLFLLPGMLLFLVWTLSPLLYAFVMSFTEWNLIKPSAFTGLKNYTRAFGDPIFWLAMRNTIQYVLITVPGQMILGLGIALLLNKPLRARGFFRTVFYLPVITSWVVVSLIFIYLFNSQAGLINYLLRDVLHVIDSNINWLGEPATGNIAIAILGIWKGIGWTMIMFLAGLQAVDSSLYEAAAIDGANSWQRLRYITLPLIRRTTTLILVLLTIGGFQVFISVYIMTNGGPVNRTQVLLTYMYSNAFQRLDLGYASALSYIFALLMVLFNFVQIRALQRTKED